MNRLLDLHCAHRPVPFLYLINFVNSVVTRKIRWRGVGYELMSSNETQIITP